VVGSLSALIRSKNFEGKERFVFEFNGLDFLARIICEEASSEIKQSLRLQKKALVFLFDLVCNDDNINIKDPHYCRRKLGDCKPFMKTMLGDLASLSLDESPTYQVREYILRTLFYIY
jgi:hypothetical protein